MNIYYLNIVFLIVFLPKRLQFRYTTTQETVLICDGGAMQRTKKAGPNLERAKSKKTYRPLPVHVNVVNDVVMIVVNGRVASEEALGGADRHGFAPYFHGVNYCKAAYQTGYYHGLSGYNSGYLENFVFHYKFFVEGIKQPEAFDVRSMPRVKRMSFTEACALSKELSDSRKERLLRASFDGPE